MRKTVLAAEFILVNFKVSRKFQEIHNIKGAWGTAVTIQYVVFGNIYLKSGSVAKNSKKYVNL